MFLINIFPARYKYIHGNDGNPANEYKTMIYLAGLMNSNNGKYGKHFQGGSGHMNQNDKARIDRLVSIWITGLRSTSADAGWEGMSLAARMIEYLGDPPGPSGNDQSNLAMINAIRLLRNQHAEFPLIAAVMCVLMRMRDTREIALAIAARHFYQGLCQWTDRAWTNDDRAAMLDMTTDQYKWYLKRAYPVIQKELERVTIYSRYVS